MELGRNKKFKISVVVPVYCEEGNINELYKRVKENLPKNQNQEIIFVDDGSSDRSLEIIKKIAKNDTDVIFLSFSRNFGHQPALKAGLDHSTGDCIISLDADLQHPPELIPDLLKKWIEGYDVVLTQRLPHPNTPFFKRFTSRMFYKFINRVSSLNMDEGSADFRLLDKKVISELKKLPEADLFFRGLISWLGFKQSKISYHPDSRAWGETKYTLGKMIRFSISGITSFSTRPLHLSTLLGFSISGLCLIYGIYVLYIKVFTDRSISGWASVVMSTLFIGGVQLVMLGVIGEYLGKLFIQSKGRPSYVIKEKSEDLSI